MKQLASGIFVPDEWARSVAEGGKPVPNSTVPDIYKSSGYVQRAAQLYKSLQESKLPPFRRKLMPGLALLGVYEGINDPGQAHARLVDILRRISQSWFIRAIIETRIKQLRRFCKRPRFLGDAGARMQLKDRNAHPTAQDRIRMEAILDWWLRGGDESYSPIYDAKGVYSRDGLTRALPAVDAAGVFVRDLYTLGMATFWVEPTQDSRWGARMMTPLDAGLMRRTFPKLPPDTKLAEDVGTYTPYTPRLRPEMRHAEWVMVHPNNPREIIAEYHTSEVNVAIENPRSDYWTQGYGYSPLESALELVVGMLTAVQYNTSWFTENHVPPAILVGAGSYSEDWLSDFLQTFIQQSGGPGKWHKLPVLFGAEDAKLQYIPLKDYQHDDMRWRDWMWFVLTAICALMQIAPEEMNFTSFRPAGSGMGDKNDTAERVTEAKDTGFRDLVYTYEAFINNVLQLFFIDEQSGMCPYEFRMCGIDENDEEREINLRRAELESGLKTPNEQRANADDAPYYDPMDPVLWRRIMRKVRDRAAARGTDLEADRALWMEITAEAYEAAGGELRMWPDLPVSPLTAQARSQDLQSEQQKSQMEMMQQQQAGMGMGMGMGADQGDEEDTGQHQTPWSLYGHGNDVQEPDEGPGQSTGGMAKSVTRREGDRLTGYIRRHNDGTLEVTIER